MTQEEVESMPQVELRVSSKDNPMGGAFVAAFRALPIALMRVPPEVVIWGERFFKFAGRQTKGREDFIYVECMAYPLIPRATCEEVEPANE